MQNLRVNFLRSTAEFFLFTWPLNYDGFWTIGCNYFFSFTSRFLWPVLVPNQLKVRIYTYPACRNRTHNRKWRNCSLVVAKLLPPVYSTTTILVCALIFLKFLIPHENATGVPSKLMSFNTNGVY